MISDAVTISNPVSRTGRVCRATEAGHDSAKCPLLDVDDPPPRDVVGVKARDATQPCHVVRQSGEEVVRRGHRVGVAREVDVDLVLGNYPSCRSTRPAALDPEYWAQRRLAQRRDSPVAEFPHSLSEASRSGRLALPRLGWA